MPGSPSAPGNAPAPQSSSGHLVVTVLDHRRRPLRAAEVWIQPRNGIPPRISGIDGTVSFEGVPAFVPLEVGHALGTTNVTASVAQRGVTRLDVIVEPHLPRPTVGMLPVEIVAGSVSADRRELSLRVTVVSSRASAFLPVGVPEDRASPYLGISFDPPPSGSSRDCSVFVSRVYPVATCATWGSPRFVVTMESFGYDEAGIIPLPTDPSTTSSTMLLLEQSARISSFDAKDVRAMSAENFIDRYLAFRDPARTLCVAGFAGSASAIPETPVWMPRGSGCPPSNDAMALQSDIDVLLPLTGGNAPVLTALQTAIDRLSSGTPVNSRNLVAVIGGDDDSGMDEQQRVAALESLRLRRVAGGVRTIIIGAFRNVELAERARIADLAEALQALTVSSGTAYYETTLTTGEQHLYAATDLAADLLGSARLPVLSATFRVRAPAPGAFAAGSLLRGELYLQSEVCPFDCSEAPLSFAARVP